MSTNGTRFRAPAISLDTVRSLAGLLGVVLLLVAAGYWLVNGVFDTPMRLLAAAGIVLVGIYIAIDPEDVWGRLSARGSIYGGNTLVLAIAFLAILGLVNVVGQRRHERWDLTANKQYSLAEQTIQLLAGLDEPVHMIGFFSDQDQRRQDVQDLLREYETRSNGRISYEFVDPEVRPAVAQRYQIKEFGTTILIKGDQQQRVTGTRESDFTTGLLRLIRPSQKKIYFSTGHNERRLDASDERNYSQLKTSLESDNFVVEPVNLFATQLVPEDASVVVIADPRTPLLDEEKQAISDYLDRGGHLLLLSDPRQSADLNDLVARWNVQIDSNPVVDPRVNLLGDLLTPAVQRYAFHKITEQLPFTFYPFVGGITAPRPADAPRGVTFSNLVETSPESWVETDQTQIRFDEGTDLKGPLTLAVAIEAQLQDGTTSSATEGQDKKPVTRVVVFGDSDFVSNGAFRIGSGNRDLFLNAANWVAETEELISIRPKPSDQRTVFMTGTQQNLVFWSTFVFMPLLVLAVGVVVWWSRR